MRKVMVLLVLLVMLGGVAWAGDTDWYIVVESKPLALSGEWTISDAQIYFGDGTPYREYGNVIVQEGLWGDIKHYLDQNYVSYNPPKVYRVERINIECDVTEHKEIREVEEITKEYNWKILNGLSQ